MNLAEKIPNFNDEEKEGQNGPQMLTREEMTKDDADDSELTDMDNLYFEYWNRVDQAKSDNEKAHWVKEFLSQTGEVNPEYIKRIDDKTLLSYFADIKNRSNEDVSRPINEIVRELWKKLMAADDEGLRAI